MIIDKISSIKTSKLEATTATPLASKEVLQGLRSGRVGVVVANNGESDVFIGDENVSADNGLPIKAGEKMELSVSDSAKDNIYIVGGTVTIAEYYR